MKRRAHRKSEVKTPLELSPTSSLDIHGMSVIEAKNYLDMGLNLLPKKVKIIAIIHGYQSGTRLKRMVQKEYTHVRLNHKLSSPNLGQTIFILN